MQAMIVHKCSGLATVGLTVVLPWALVALLFLWRLAQMQVKRERYIHRERRLHVRECGKAGCQVCGPAREDGALLLELPETRRRQEISQEAFQRFEAQGK